MNITNANAYDSGRDPSELDTISLVNVVLAFRTCRNHFTKLIAINQPCTVVLALVAALPDPVPDASPNQ